MRARRGNPAGSARPRNRRWNKPPSDAAALGEIVVLVLPWNFAEGAAGALGASLVKPLIQVGAEMMEDNSRLSHRPVMVMAGNDALAKATVATLQSDLGFEPLDAGDLTKARILEPYGLVSINPALAQGRNWAFAAVGAK